MLLKILFCLSLLLSLNSQIWANPTTLETQAKGYNPYPVLQCPKTSDQIKNLLKRVQTLKDAIKKDAKCEKTGEETIKQTNKLSSLVGDQRKEFLALLQKGESEGLNDQEQAKIQNYVSSLMTTSDTLIKVLTGNDGCFKEDKKASSLSFITSLISEGSKIISLVGGPAVAGTVSIASNVVVGFLEGMKSIRENRSGFRFEDYEQREAYSESLCSLFDYKKEVRTFIYPKNTVQNLEKLSHTLDKQLQLLLENCIECQDIANRIKSLEANGKTRSEIWSKSFEDEIKKAAAEANKNYARPLGTHTYRSLRTKAWIAERIKVLKDNSIQADLGLQEVVTQLADIEAFMIEQQSYAFLYHLSEQSRNTYDLLRGRMGGLPGRLLKELNQTHEAIKPPTSFYDTYEVRAAEVYMVALNEAYQKTDRIGRAKIETLMEQIDSSLSQAVIGLGVSERYCVFFQNARWFTRSIERECENPIIKKYRSDIEQFLMSRSQMNSIALAPDLERSLELQDEPAAAVSSPGEPQNPPSQKSPFTIQSNRLTQDWAESLEKTVEEWTQNPDYVRRTNMTPR